MKRPAFLITLLVILGLVAATLWGLRAWYNPTLAEEQQRVGAQLQVIQARKEAERKAKEEAEKAKQPKPTADSTRSSQPNYPAEE